MKLECIYHSRLFRLYQRMESYFTLFCVILPIILYAAILLYDFWSCIKQSYRTILLSAGQTSALLISATPTRDWILFWQLALNIVRNSVSLRAVKWKMFPGWFTFEGLCLNFKAKLCYLTVTILHASSNMTDLVIFFF